MVVDGSPFRLMGEIVPFTATPESVLNVNINAFDLKRVAPYLEDTLPIKILGGSLSSRLRLHFIQPASGPVIEIRGTIDLEGVDVHDASNRPLASFKTASVALTDVDPVRRIAVLGDIVVDGLVVHLARQEGGSTNFTPLTALALPKWAESGKGAVSRNDESVPFHFSVRSFDLVNSELDLRDTTTATPVVLALKGVHVGFKNFTYDARALAFPFQVQARLGDGSLGLRGNLDLAHSLAAFQVAFHEIDLRPLQGFAQRFWAGTLTSGQFNAKAQVETDFAPHKFNVVLQPADLFLETLELHAPGDTQKPVKLKKLGVVLDRLDLNGHQAVVKEVHLDGLSLSVRRRRDRSVSLDSFLRAAKPQFSAPATPATKSGGQPKRGASERIEVQNQPVTIIPSAASKPAPVWQYQIASVSAENVETEIEDDSKGRPIILNASPLNVHLKDVSSGSSNPIALNIDASLKPYGGFKIDGTVGIDPLTAKLHVVTTKLDLRPADVYLSSRLSAKLDGAALTMDGNFGAARERDTFTFSYHGNVATEVRDTRTAQPIMLNAAPLTLDLKDVSSDLSKPIALNIDATLKPYGGFKIDGTVAFDPLAAKLHVVTTKVDLSPADIYLSRRFNVKLSGAALTMDGNLEAARERDNFSLSYRGDAALGNLLLTDKLTNERLLRCSALRASRIDANIGDGAPHVAVGEVALADFRALVILNSDANLNLGDLARARTAAPQLIISAIESSGRGPPQAPTAEPQTATVAAPLKSPIDADISVGKITLKGGAINYTDNFIRPHYTVDLTNLAGEIGGFGTRSTSPAEVEVKGLINSVSPIAIRGSLNPLAPEAFVDIEAQSDGYQLINLTAYSAKYTGYPITMGTLKVDVHYLVQNRQLTATNHLFISRLSLGEKVQSPNAIDLPIALAVKLLKNPRGEIDITLPVSGSLDDPQFSVGALFLQALKDVILKIVESPFEVLATVAGVEGGSSQNLQHVPFPPGQATLTPAAKSQLSTVAKAMQNRPELRLTLTPRVDPSTDRPSLGALMVDRLVKMQKVEEIRAQGDSAEVATVELTPAEYDKYLTVVYKQAKAAKPYNPLGSGKSLPPDEMKTVLAENMKVTDDDLMKLAIARVVAVGDYLDQQVDPVRLAVVPPNVGSPETDDSGRHTAGVDLTVD
jgi:hypothetical protein